MKSAQIIVLAGGLEVVCYPGKYQTKIVDDVKLIAECNGYRPHRKPFKKARWIGTIRISLKIPNGEIEGFHILLRTSIEELYY